MAGFYGFLWYDKNVLINATLAQLAEQRFRKAWVRSSNLRGGSIKKHLPCGRLFFVERVTGIEPVSYPWEGYVLPLNHTRCYL